MEVHTHTHTPRKKWTHYFWEFLMLFLAVFCGFLAEYQLEHKIEKERGNQYVISFYKDLVSDTARYTGIINNYRKKVAALKNYRNCFDSLKQKAGSSKCLENLFNYSERFADLIYSDGTLQQLRNAGGFRLLNNEDADSISSYENLIHLYLKFESTGYQETQASIRSVIFDLKKFETDEGRELVSFYDDQPNLLNRYFNLLERYLNISSINLQVLMEIKSKTIQLILFFKNKYDLK